VSIANDFDAVVTPRFYWMGSRKNGPDEVIVLQQNNAWYERRVCRETEALYRGIEHGDSASSTVRYTVGLKKLQEYEAKQFLGCLVFFRRKYAST